MNQRASAFMQMPYDWKKQLFSPKKNTCGSDGLRCGRTRLLNAKAGDSGTVTAISFGGLIPWRKKSCNGMTTF